MKVKRGSKRKSDGEDYEKRSEILNKRFKFCNVSYTSRIFENMSDPFLNMM